MVKFEDGKTVLFVANGNLLSLVEVVDGSKLVCLQSIHVFQKPIQTVVYDKIRKRVIAAGLDQQVKFFEIFDENKDIEGKDEIL